MITTITRRTKKEAEIAINDLLDRGFTVVFPLTEIRQNGYSRGIYNYQKNRYSMNQSMTASCWIAKLSIEDKQRQVMTRNDKEVTK
jgi:hypothetical protein